MCASFLFMYYFQFMDRENLSISMVLELFWYNLEKCHLHNLQNHLMLYNFQDIILLEKNLSHNS
jgi:hypothetical protein